MKASIIPKYRTFGGKRYRRAYTATTKRGAEADAKSLRDAGSSARVVKYGGKYYVVYARG